MNLFVIIFVTLTLVLEGTVDCAKNKKRWKVLEKRVTTLENRVTLGEITNKENSEKIAALNVTITKLDDVCDAGYKLANARQPEDDDGVDTEQAMSSALDVEIRVLTALDRSNEKTELKMKELEINSTELKRVVEQIKESDIKKLELNVKGLVYENTELKTMVQQIITSLENNGVMLVSPEKKDFLDEWRYYKGFSYKFFTDEVDLVEARRFCWRQNHAAYLVNFLDIDEVNFVVELARGRPFWISLYRRPYASDWKWSYPLSRDNVSYLNWRPGQPDGDLSQYTTCAHVAGKAPFGMWDRSDCLVKRQFVCKKNE